MTNKLLEGVVIIRTENETLPTRERILNVCIKLFLTRGYKKTTISDIVHGANVSNSSFQHYFRAKDGVLTELVRLMFSNQFDVARLVTGTVLPPIYIYAVETAIQIGLTELNENLREIYIEAYTHEEALNFIQQHTAKELYQIFSPFQPELTEYDFYLLDLGTSGLMRGYMARPCDQKLTLERKLSSFLCASLRVFRVPETEVEAVCRFVADLNICAIAQKVMAKLFQTFAVQLSFGTE